MEIYAVVVYEMKDEREERQPVYSEQELQAELSSVQIELKSKGTYVVGFHIDAPKPKDYK